MPRCLFPQKTVSRKYNELNKAKNVFNSVSVCTFAWFDIESVVVIAILAKCNAPPIKRIVIKLESN